MPSIPLNVTSTIFRKGKQEILSAIYRNSPLPRYYQLKEIMRDRIRSGEWKPGDLIPSERELGEQYGISRMTARQAITDLVNEGLFYREQGKGLSTATTEARSEVGATRILPVWRRRPRATGTLHVQVL